jgi:hypothetical protein
VDFEELGAARGLILDGDRGFGRVARELKVRVGEQAVEEDDEFAHDGGEGDFGGFASFAQALVKDAQDGVVADGGEGGHVEDVADRFAPAGNAAGAGIGAAILVVGSDACQGGGFLVTEGAQFGHLGEQGRGGHRTHAGDGLQAVGLGLKRGVGGEQFNKGAVAFTGFAF